MAAGRPIFRIFVSSTFSDFVAEREALRANLFPRLQELCRTHDASLIPVDLRWGVSREAAENRRTISICLGEIDLSVAMSPPPNFIALIGDRLGYQPAPEVIEADEFDLILAALALDPTRAADCAFVRSWYRRDDNAVGPEYRLLSRPGDDTVTEPWEAAEDRLRRILAAGGRLAGFDARRLLRYEGSVTEQELVHRGLFAGAVRADEVVCVFRTIDAPADADGPWCDANDDARERQRGLVRLLNDRCGPSALHYRAAWTDTGPAPEALEAMCEQLYARLSATMLARLGELGAQDPTSTESEAHVGFAHQLASGFVGRCEALQAIRAYLAGTARHPLVVHGASGVGKSALLACAAIEAARASAGVSVLRFVGSVPGSRSSVALLGSLCSELRRHLGHDGAVEATDYPSLVAELRALLAFASVDRPILLVVDALDRLETDAGARIGWLPDPLPAHVHVLVSTTPGPVLDAIDARTPAAIRLALQAMPVAEGRVLLDQWLAGARRRLQPRQHDAVLAAWTEAGGLPLFLRLAFEEALHWHSDEAPAAAAAADVPAMVHRLVEHLSSSDEHGVLLVQRSLACIAAGKNGLAEDELLEVLSADAEVMKEFRQRHPDSPHVDALPPLILARLHDELRPYLRYSRVDGTQTVGFLHAQFESVIADDYLQRGSRPARHEALARHFETMWRKDIVDGVPKPRLRPLAELPFQWAHAGKLVELDQLLLDFAFLQGKLSAFGVQALVEDLALALSLPGRDEKMTHGLAALRDTLLLSADLLGVQPEQLAAQLHARLGQSGEPLIEALLDAASPPGTGTWLRPVRRCLPDAGGPLVATIRVGDEVGAVAVSPDSTLAVSASGKMLDVWDLATLTRIRRIETSGEWRSGGRLHILADGDTLIAMPHSGPLAAFSLASGERLWGLGAADARFTQMSLTADEQRLLAGNGGWLVLWDLPTRSALWQIELPPLPKRQQSRAFGRQFRASTITADGARIVAAESNGPIRVWNVGRRRLERQLKGCLEELEAFIAGTAPTRVAGFAVAAYSKLDAWLKRAPGIDNRQDLFPEGVDTIYVRHVVEWDTATGKRVADRRFGSEVGYTNGLALHRPAKQLVSASNSGPIDLIDLDGSAAPTSLLGHDSSARSVALFTGGTRALSASRDGTIKLWDLGRAFERPRTLNHSGHVGALSFGPDGAMVASASLDRSAIVWREQAGTIKGVQHSTGFGVKSLHLLPDGQSAFAVCYDKRCRIFDLHSFEAEVVDSTEYAERMLGAALSADGRTAVVAYQTEDVDVDGATFTSNIHVLDLVSRQVVQRYSSDHHESSFAGDWIAFRPGGDEVISSAETWTCVWSCSSGTERARHRTPRIRAMVLAPGGDHAWLAIDESIQALDLRTGGLTRLASAGAAITRMACCEAAGLVVTAAREVSLWDTERWVCLARYVGDAEMTACAIAPEGDRIVVGDAVGRVHMLEPRSRGRSRPWPMSRSGVCEPVADGSARSGGIDIGIKR